MEGQPPRLPSSLSSSDRPVPLLEMFDDAARIANRETRRQDVPNYNTSGSNYAVVANRHARTNHTTASQPHIVSYAYCFGRFQSAPSNSWLKRMERSVNVIARPNLHVVSDGDEITVKENTPIVDEPIAPDADVYTVVATEWRLNLRAATDLTEHSAQQRKALLSILIWDRVQLS